MPQAREMFEFISSDFFFFVTGICKWTGELYFNKLAVPLINFLIWVFMK